MAHLDMHNPIIDNADCLLLTGRSRPSLEEHKVTVHAILLALEPLGSTTKMKAGAHKAQAHSLRKLHKLLYIWTVCDRISFVISRFLLAIATVGVFQEGPLLYD